MVDLAKWRLVISSHFSNMEVKTLQNGVFFSWENCQINVVVESEFITNCKYAQKGHLDCKKNHFDVNFAPRKLKKILYNLQKGLFKVI